MSWLCCCPSGSGFLCACASNISLQSCHAHKHKQGRHCNNNCDSVGSSDLQRTCCCLHGSLTSFNCSMVSASLCSAVGQCGRKSYSLKPLTATQLSTVDSPQTSSVEHCVLSQTASMACIWVLPWSAGATGYHALPDWNEQVEQQGGQCPHKGNHHGFQFSQEQPPRDSQ